VSLGAVQHHVADRVTFIDEHIQIGQGTDRGADKSRLPHWAGASHDGHADGCTQGGLAD
jgi:hypothetical protein